MHAPVEGAPSCTARLAFCGGTLDVGPRAAGEAARAEGRASSAGPQSESMEIVARSTPSVPTPSRAAALVSLTYALSGAAWGAAWLADLDVSRGLGLVALALGGVAPALVAMLLASRDGTLRRDLSRILDPRPLARSAALPIVAWPVGAWLGTWAILRATTGTSIPMAGAPSSPGALAMMALAVLVFGPLPEEIAWRGYLLPRIAARCSPRVSALVTGAVWVVWHLPLFVLRGMPLGQSYPLGSPAFVAWALAMLALSVLFVDLARRTGGSTLAAVALHFTLNFSSALVGAAPSVMTVHFAVLVGIGAVHFVRLDRQVIAP